MDKGSGTTRINRTVKKKIFYYSMMFLPILQILICYFYINISSFALAFKEFFAGSDGLLDYTWTLSNFEGVFTILTERSHLIWNSLVGTFFKLVICVGIGVFFSFYIYKNKIGSNFFKVILFLPQIVSVTIFALLFSYICEDVYINIVMSFGKEMPTGLFKNPDTAFTMVIIFNVWIGFGNIILIMIGTMSGINESLVESMQLDGANLVQEFFYLTLPLVYPTLTIFVITDLSALFTSSLQLFTFFEASAPSDIQTFGYVFVRDVKYSSYLGKADQGFLSYSQLSALGLTFSALTITVITALKVVLKKFGPSVDN